MFKISIIGRPNVGKSTLFNRLTRSRSAVVHESYGITRDRKARLIEVEGSQAELVDTGGIIFSRDDTMQTLVTKQALYALEESNLILLLMDVNELLPIDLEILETVRKSGKNHIIAINKVDNKHKEDLLFDFYSQGINNFISLSAIHNTNIKNLEKEISLYIPRDIHGSIPIKDIPRICIVGKPNVGKSTYINALLNKERLIVSDIPGTTRDSIDTMVYYYKKPYIFIDTSGLRKKNRSKEGIEGLFNSSTVKSIENSDIVMLMIDSTEGFTNQDHKIINIIEKKGRCLMMGLNKWDLVEKDTMTFKNYQDDIYERVHNWGRFPLISFSAKDRNRITHIFKAIDTLNETSRNRIPTAKLNTFINLLFSGKIAQSAVPKGNIKVYYAANIGIKPHRFIFWVNHPEQVKSNLQRYLTSRIRNEYKLEGVYIELFFKERAKKK